MHKTFIFHNTLINAGAGAPPVIFFCPLSFSSDFDRGTTHILVFTYMKRNLGGKKLLHNKVESLDYSIKQKVSVSFLARESEIN